ncbi:hypothetical protein LCGC14_0844010 [marine sediment metagenome]|uniref:Uncharacterized protein n=1 Tax=marine sediment metagenome TaxID=412755 RepID=A0A0F9RWX8_9ZZZZ
MKGFISIKKVTKQNKLKKKYPIYVLNEVSVNNFCKMLGFKEGDRAKKIVDYKNKRIILEFRRRYNTKLVNEQ